MVGIAIFTFILLNRSPNILRPISLAVRTGFTLAIPPAAILLFLSFRIRRSIEPLISFSLTMALFACSLAGLWISGGSDTTTLSGLLPIQDALAFYSDALQILSGGIISAHSAMRPFYAGFLSFLLAVGGRNLLVALSVIAAAGGISSYLAGREFLRTHGPAAATFMIIMLFLYFRFHSGKTMSESLGMPLGALGCALIWRSISLRQPWIAILGLGSVALALNVRPGAMFILPVLLLWTAWYFRGDRWLSIPILLAGTTAILIFFIANLITIRILAGSQDVPFSNFAWAFYGLASGGNSWAYIFQAHPEVSRLAPSEQTRAIYALAIELIKQEPYLLVKGALHNWGMFFSNTWYNVFSFVSGENYLVGIGARWLLYGLTVLGIFRWVVNRYDPFGSMAVISTLGVLISVPFVPPADAYRVRLYAATIPFSFLLPLLGLNFILEKFKPTGSPETSETHQDANVTGVFSVLIMIFTLFPPAVLKASSAPPGVIETGCTKAMDSITVNYDSGTYVNIIGQNLPLLDWMPNFHQGTFRRSMHGNTDVNLIRLMEGVEASNTLFYSLDFQSSQPALVIVPTRLLPDPGTLVKFCGESESDPSLSAYHLFYPETAIPAVEGTP